MGDNLMRREQLRAYTANWSLKVKVLDFIKSGGPFFTVDRTVCELRLGSL